MGRNYPSNFNSNYSSNHNTMRTKLYNELVSKQEQYKFNAENGADNYVKC